MIVHYNFCVYASDVSYFTVEEEPPSENEEEKQKSEARATRVREIIGRYSI